MTVVVVTSTVGFGHNDLATGNAIFGNVDIRMGAVRFVRNCDGSKSIILVLITCSSTLSQVPSPL